MREGGTVEIIQGLLLAFAIVVILMPGYIRLLRYVGIGKQIREEGPNSHLVKEGTPTMGGLLIVLVVVALAFFFGAMDAVDLLAAGRAPRRRPARRLRRLPQRQDGHGHQRPPEVRLATRRGDPGRVYIQNHFAITDIRVPFVGDVEIGRPLYILFAAFAIIAASNGVNITDGLDGLAGGTTIFAFVAFLIIAVLNVPHQPNLAFVCAVYRGGPRLPVVQRPPGPDLHGRFGRAVPGGDARGDRAHHRPDPRPAAHRVHLRDRDRLGGPPGRLLQGHRRQADLPDDPDPPPLRAGGWDEEKITLRFWIIAILAGLLGVTFFLASINALPVYADRPDDGDDGTTERPIDLDGLTLADVQGGALRGRPVTVLGLARSGISLVRFFRGPGATVTVYDGRPAGELRGGAIDGAIVGCPGAVARRAGGRSRRCPGRRRARRDIALDQPGLPDDRASPSRCARRAGRGAAGRRPRPRPPSCPRWTCSCACARRRRSA